MKIAINGFGRIGRIFFRQAFNAPDFDIVIINDLGDVENLAYLLKYDSVYGRYGKNIEVKNRNFVIDDKEIKVFNEKDPVNLPWKDLDIDIVVESTGVFDSYEKAKVHLEAGAKRVVITAPSKDDKTATATPNVGIEFLEDCKITSNASCTTNAATPVASIMSLNPGIKKAVLNTVHGYTASQPLVDGANKDFKLGRAGAVNIIPTHTGAAIATEKAMPELTGIFDGVALRVPVIAGSIIDFTFISKRKTTVEEINGILKEAAEMPEWQGIFKVSNEPLVSTDILGEPYGSIADLAFTRVVDHDLVKILSWYDNEYGYCAMLIKHIEALQKFL